MGSPTSHARALTDPKPVSSNSSMKLAWFLSTPAGSAAHGAWRPYLWAVALIVAATLVSFFWLTTVGPRNLALLFFAAIMFTGAWLGLKPALLSAGVAFLCYNFLLIEPRYTFHFTPADALALTAFLIGAMIVGGLAGGLSDRARVAASRLRDMTSLLEASRELSGVMESEEAGRSILRLLEERGYVAALWIQGVSQRIASAGVDARATALEPLLGDLRESATASDMSGGAFLIPLGAGGRFLGQVAVWAEGEGLVGLADRTWLETLADLGAIAIDRARLAAEVAEARIVAEKEGLRTALLSSLSHDLRTPIATVLASTTSLLDQGDKFTPETRSDLLESIQGASERLSRYITNLLEMTRLESGALRLRPVLMDPCEAMSSALSHLERDLKSRKVVRNFRADGRLIEVDSVLLEQAIVNVVENAIKHAGPDSPIEARVALADQHVLLSIEDRGPGIPPGDIEHVFDMFFRGRDRRSDAGVGLGLAVTRGLVESFGGSVRAVSPARDGRGARIELLLPARECIGSAE